mmetsp:Transcript_61193/g.118008  ORF Transcript_61193/g.118008 Transcript_61193/m.118008 type:complete len:125 (-) Transcript_61193:670-1044(-)
MAIWKLSVKERVDWVGVIWSSRARSCLRWSHHGCEAWVERIRQEIDEDILGEWGCQWGATAWAKGKPRGLEHMGCAFREVAQAGARCLRATMGKWDGTPTVASKLSPQENDIIVFLCCTCAGFL